MIFFSFLLQETPGSVNSFLRGCEDKPLVGIKEKISFIWLFTHYLYCFYFYHKCKKISENLFNLFFTLSLQER